MDDFLREQLRKGKWYYPVVCVGLCAMWGPNVIAGSLPLLILAAIVYFPVSELVFRIVCRYAVRPRQVLWGWRVSSLLGSVIAGLVTGAVLGDFGTMIAEGRTVPPTLVELWLSGWPALCISLLAGFVTTVAWP